MRTRIATRNSAKGKGMRKTSKMMKHKSAKAKAYATFKRKLSIASS